MDIEKNKKKGPGFLLGFVRVNNSSKLSCGNCSPSGYSALKTQLSVSTSWIYNSVLHLSAALSAGRCLLQWRIKGSDCDTIYAHISRRKVRGGYEPRKQICSKMYMIIIHRKKTKFCFSPLSEGEVSVTDDNHKQGGTNASLIYQWDVQECAMIEDNVCLLSAFHTRFKYQTWMTHTESHLMFPITQAATHTDTHTPTHPHTHTHTHTHTHKSTCKIYKLQWQEKWYMKECDVILVFNFWVLNRHTDDLHETREMRWR